MKVANSTFAFRIVIAVFLSTFVLSLMIVPVHSESAVKVGLYYYVWYKGNWTENHENCRDVPVLGGYNSQDPAVINWHLEWFTDLNIDFLIVSWWGNGSFSEREDAEFIDSAVQQLFSTVRERGCDMELAILVEPFNTSSGLYDFQTIYGYIHDNFVTRYSDLYMKLDAKPLLLFYNEDVNMTRDGAIPLDDRFEIRISGHQSYVDWVYWSVDVERWGEGEPDILGQTEQKLCRDGEINVVPRYDDEHFRPGEGVSRPIDRTYAEGLYDKQWSRVLDLAREGKVSIVTITSWNEYPERTAVEPHCDMTAYDRDPYFLYQKTKEYISRLKGVSTSFIDFVEEVFEDIKGLSPNRCRYSAVDNLGYGLHTLRIIDNPEGGYLGVYHSFIEGNFQVRLANSSDLLNWTFIRTIEENASQPTITQSSNAYIIGFEKEDASSHLKIHYYSSLSTLKIGPANFTIDIPRSLSSMHEGTPNIYNVTIRDSVMNACIGFHYYNGTVDNVAVGCLAAQLDNSGDYEWNATHRTDYNHRLRKNWNVKGNIGDREFGQIFGRNFTLQEGNLDERSPIPVTNWSAWRTFLYDHSTNKFTMLNIKTHGSSASFGNPTFTWLESPDGKDCLVVTYFLFSEGAAPGEAGELIFYKEFDKKDEEIPYEGNTYPVSIYSNSTISNFYFNKSETSINLNADGPNQTHGYCIFKLPSNLTQDLWNGNYTVLLDGEANPFEDWTDEEDTYIYVNYGHSEHKITIIPEFPSFLIIPLFMVITLLAVVNHRRKNHNR